MSPLLYIVPQGLYAKMLKESHCNNLKTQELAITYRVLIRARFPIESRSSADDACHIVYNELVDPAFHDVIRYVPVRI